MRPRANKKNIFLAGLLLAVCLSLAPINKAYADTRPYFKAFGADVFAGGWFNQSTSPCSTSLDPPSPYQDEYYRSSTQPPDKRYGGILTYAKQDSNGFADGGSSSQYGAFGLGLVDSFYSG